MNICIDSPTTTNDLIKHLFLALESENFHDAIEIIDLIIENPHPLSPSFLNVFREVISTQNWDLLSDIFLSKAFVGHDGYFLWVAPFSIRRQGDVLRKLTGIYGRIINTPFPNEFSLTKTLRSLQKIQHLPNEMLSFEGIYSFGLTGNDEGEAFLVPNGWRFKGSRNGPGLNDLRLQRARFLNYGKNAIQTIFDKKTSEMLLSWSETETSAYLTQHLEFQFHEFGHYCGIPLSQKIAQKFFLTPWYAAVEEWRSDGVAFHLAEKSLSESDLSNMIAANLALRFGTDAQRAGGMNLDSDVNSTLILFDHLLQSGSLSITPDFKLSLECKTLADLPDLVRYNSQSALLLTREELKLEDPRGAWNLYGGISISPVSKTLFNLIVRKNTQEKGTTLL